MSDEGLTRAALQVPADDDQLTGKYPNIMIYDARQVWAMEVFESDREIAEYLVRRHGRPIQAQTISAWRRDGAPDKTGWEGLREIVGMGAMNEAHWYGPESELSVHHRFVLFSQRVSAHLLGQLDQGPLFDENNKPVSTLYKADGTKVPVGRLQATKMSEVTGGLKQMADVAKASMEALRILTDDVEKERALLASMAADLKDALKKGGAPLSDVQWDIVEAWESETVQRLGGEEEPVPIAEGTWEDLDDDE